MNSASNDRRDIRRRERDIRRHEFDNFDPYDPLDVGVRIGMDSWFRRTLYSRDIRETDADLKKEELKQQRLKTRILEDIADGVGEMRERHHLEIPKEVLVQ